MEKNNPLRKQIMEQICNLIDEAHNKLEECACLVDHKADAGDEFLNDTVHSIDEVMLKLALTVEKLHEELNEHFPEVAEDDAPDAFGNKPSNDSIYDLTQGDV